MLRSVLVSILEGGEGLACLCILDCGEGLREGVVTAETAARRAVLAVSLGFLVSCIIFGTLLVLVGLGIVGGMGSCHLRNCIFGFLLTFCGFYRLWHTFKQNEAEEMSYHYLWVHIFHIHTST